MSIFGNHLKELCFLYFQMGGAGSVGGGGYPYLTYAAGGGSQADMASLQSKMGDLGTAIDGGNFEEAKKFLREANPMMANLQSSDTGSTKDKFQKDKSQLQAAMTDLGKALDSGDSKKAQEMLKKVNDLALKLQTSPK